MIVGKAAAFAAELQRSPRGLGLPRQGSKYAPMVDHLVAGLRRRGVLRHPTGLLIRIGLSALDRLEALGDLRIRLPRFLDEVMPPDISCREFSRQWSRVASNARESIYLLSRLEFGQHVHLAKLLCVNARRDGWRDAALRDGRLGKLVRALCQGEELAEFAVYRLGEDLPRPAVETIERLLALREEQLAIRRSLVREARSTHAGGRLVPDPERMGACCRELELIDLQLLLLVAAYVRRLWQRAESLPYLNDRPYTLALYLLFGSDVFGPICRSVEFDVEYVSQCVGANAPPECAQQPER